jgi:glycosyltransferase involved in cell wall biosynthesis
MHSKKEICWIIANPLTINFFLLDHIKLLGSKYNLTVITNTEDLDFLDFLNVPIKVISVRMERNISLWVDLLALIRLVIVLRRSKYDIVHTLSPKSGLLGIVASWLVRVPIRVHTFQGEVWLTRKGFLRALLKLMDRLLVKCSTHLLVVSSSEKDFLVNEGIFKHESALVLANGSICGVDVERFKPNPFVRNSIRADLDIKITDILLLYVGRLNVDKGLFDLADSFALLKEKYQNLHLLVVGPDEDDMRSRMIFKSGNYERLHFVGHTPNPEDYMAAADVLCLPSYREGFGMVLIEAAAVGIPTVGSNIYGISDAIEDRVTGLLFQPANVKDLSEKLEHIISSPALASSLGLSGMNRVHQFFSREKVLGAFLSYYELLLSEPKK